MGRIRGSSSSSKGEKEAEEKKNREEEDTRIHKDVKEDKWKEGDKKIVKGRG